MYIPQLRLMIDFSQRIFTKKINLIFHFTFKIKLFDSRTLNIVQTTNLSNVLTFKPDKRYCLVTNISVFYLLYEMHTSRTANKSHNTKSSQPNM